MNHRFCVPTLIGVVLGCFSATAPAADLPGKAAIPAELLRADPWVTPPHDARDLDLRMKELRAHYEPYLRSLPEKIDLRSRQSLNGAWRSRWELTDSTDGQRPQAPLWYGSNMKDSDWNADWSHVTVPEWRWEPIRRVGQWQKWYPASLIVWYRKHFAATPPPPGKRVFLNFAGVDWEAEVWLNGKKLGGHVGYFEPFRFEVTGLLRGENNLAVRVLDGPAFGEPISQWSVLPFMPSDKGSEQRLVMGRPDLTPPQKEPNSSCAVGSGYGIHREVYLETLDALSIGEVFARGYPDAPARVTVETEALAEKEVDLEVQILPENFEGASYRHLQHLTLAKGAGKVELQIPMPKAHAWWPAEPNLYRCRVTLRDAQRTMDVRDVLFGCREARLVSAQEPKAGLQEGQFLLNGQPVFLRGTSVGPITDLAWYWNEPRKIVDIGLMMKAANFNILRNNQHIAFPEVRELFDRLGLLSQQEQGSGFEIKAHSPKPAHLAKVVAPMARVCYNNPGVIFFSFMNESHCDMTDPIAAVAALDPERLMVPIDGALFALREPRYAPQLLGAFHRYDAWYEGIEALWKTGDPRKLDRRVLDDFHDANPKPPASFFPVMTPRRMNIVGEYGAEALDSYETMQRYPVAWGPTPALSDEAIWGSVQVNRGGEPRNIFGLRGRTPRTLGDYIESSQNYQADVLAEATKGFRLSKESIVGYYQFHFIELAPAHWAKAIVSDDGVAKKGFFEMAQVNQPVVALYRLVDRGAGLEIWAVNDLALAFNAGQVLWEIRAGERVLKGAFSGDLPADQAVCLGRVDLSEFPQGLLSLSLTLQDSAGRKISEYQRELYRSYKEVEDAARSAQERAAGRARIEAERAGRK